MHVFFITVPAQIMKDFITILNWGDAKHHGVSAVADTRGGGGARGARVPNITNRIV